MKKRLFKIVVIILILLLAKEIFMMIYLACKNEKEIIKFYNKETNFNYEEKMILEIPKINIKQIVNKADDNFKNLNNSLVYYKNNNYNKKIIIFGHSGMGYGTFFNRLDMLDLNDTIYLYINRYKITYKVDQIYTIQSSDISIMNGENNPFLLLVTCKKSDKNKRLVVKLVLKNAETPKK